VVRDRREVVVNLKVDFDGNGVRLLADELERGDNAGSSEADAGDSSGAGAARAYGPSGTERLGRVDSNHQLPD
jgi:hypothetical protein